MCEHFLCVTDVRACVFTEITTKTEKNVIVMAADAVEPSLYLVNPK